MIISARVIVAGEDGKMSCVSISLPERIKGNIRKWALANIKDSDLFYIDSERGREPHIHITVRYDLYTLDADAVTAFLKTLPPVDIRLGPISKFRESDDYDNLKIEAYGPGLQDLCHAVGEKFASKDTGLKYLPHVTLAYVKKGACEHLVGSKHFAGVRFKADHYVFLNDKAEPHHVKVASVSAPIFWITPSGKILKDGKSHREMFFSAIKNTQEYEKILKEKDYVPSATSLGFVRGIYPNNSLWIDCDENKVDWALNIIDSQMPNFAYPSSLRINNSDYTILDGEDIITAWKKRNDIRHKIASRIDYIKDDLPAEFWYKKDDSYILKPEVEKFLKERIFKALGSELKGAEKWIKNMLIGSSIATQFWKENSDIDIKIVIDEDEFKRSNTKFIKMDPDELETSLLEIFDKFKGKSIFQYKSHPFEIYPASVSHIGEEDFLSHFDSIYDIYNKTWIKEPKHIDPKTYNRDEVVEEGEEMAIQWAHEWDGDLGRIKRKVKEFELVINHLKSLPAERRQKFMDKIENLKKGLTDDIRKLSEEKDEVKQEYNESYESYDTDLEKFYGSVNALPEVIRIKMLYMWGYINIIKALTKILDDKEQIESSDVKKIDEALKTAAISFRTIR